MELLDFWSPTCGPCKVLGPHVDAFEEANEGVVKVTNINTADPTNGGITRRYRVTTVPTLVLIRDGREVSRSRGSMASKAAITSWVSRFHPGVK